MTGVVVYLVYGVLALLVLIIVIFGLGVVFLGRDRTPPVKTAPEEVTPVKAGFFAGQGGSPTSLATGKARLDSDRTGGNFLADEIRSRNSLPPLPADDDEFKL